MANVSIKFNNKEFLLACEDGQEEHLEELLIQINKKFNNLKNDLGNLGENKLLLEEHTGLSKKLDEIQSKEKLEQKKQTEFSEKIDELNQETDTLLEEIDKWQM